METRFGSTVEPEKIFDLEESPDIYKKGEEVENLIKIRAHAKKLAYFFGKIARNEKIRGKFLPRAVNHALQSQATHRSRKIGILPQ